MKIRQQHDDFQVTEHTDVVPGTEGDFAFYSLDKRGWITQDALNAIRRLWKIELKRMSYGGLKDRHAHTLQYFAIHRGPTQDLKQPSYDVKYLGQIPEAYSSERVLRNSFHLEVRGLTEAKAERMLAILPGLGQAGVPNYFDDQRFGSMVAPRRFLAKEMVLGNFEDALKLALTGYYEHDRLPAKKEKDILRLHWGEWAECKAKLSKSHARSLVDYLVHHPADYKGAYARLRPDLQGMYLSAYQSHLWNRMLDRWVIENIPEQMRATIKLKTGIHHVPAQVPEDKLAAWQQLVLPLPSARLKAPGDSFFWPIVRAVMSEEGIPIEHMKIKGLQKPFFSKGDRECSIQVHEITGSKHADELNRGKTRVSLEFSLPRGAYATMVLKRLTAIEQE